MILNESDTLKTLAYRGVLCFMLEEILALNLDMISFSKCYKVEKKYNIIADENNIWENTTE